jgi:hypothetical protein
MFCLRAAFIHRIFTGTFIGPKDKYNIRAVPVLFSIYLFIYILYLRTTFGTETPFAYFSRIAYRGRSAPFQRPMFARSYGADVIL